MKEMLLPTAVLVVWTLIMALWMLIDRARAFKAHGVDIGKAPPGARGIDLKDLLPPGSDWPAHNYMHLLEQPTVFYAAAILLALAGATGADVALAWTYVGLRIVHSVFQATINRVSVRGMIFGVSTLVMIALAIRALIAVLAMPAA